MVRSFTISRSYARIGIVLYSSRSRMILTFNQNRGVNSILRTIDRIPYPRRGTRTGAAISFAYSRLFSSSRRGRSKILIVMTDGRSQDNVRGPSNLLRRRGVRIFSLGIGKRYNMRQLLQMAGSRRNVFTADFRNLGSVVRAIKQKACKGKKAEKDFLSYGKAYPSALIGSFLVGISPYGPFPSKRSQKPANSKQTWPVCHVINYLLT